MRVRHRDELVFVCARDREREFVCPCAPAWLCPYVSSAIEGLLRGLMVWVRLFAEHGGAMRCPWLSGLICGRVLDMARKRGTSSQRTSPESYSAGGWAVGWGFTGRIVRTSEIARPSAGQMVQCNGAAVPLEDESAVTDKYQRDNVISAKLEHASAAYLARCGSASRPTAVWDVAKSRDSV